MPGHGNEDETLNVPGANGEKTSSPGASPPEPRDKSELSPSDPTLTALGQRYDVLGEIGRGGMGRVYRAHDRETGDTLALKVLKPEIASQPDLIDRFKSELLLARKITHKNVCRVYDLNRFGETAAISMEFIEGESLRSLLNRVEGLSVKHGLKIIGQMMAGLAEAHAQGVVHRDLKPENILITRDGTVKVMDFGIARSVEGKTLETSSILGTPAYMSPEQAEGKRTDTRTDIYSLGLIAYEMFAGRPAFTADTPVGLAYKQVHDRPAPLRSLDLHLPVFLERAIEKCLEKEPQKRFQSIAEIEFALSARSALTPVEREPLSAPHLSRWVRGDWILFALSVVGLVYFLIYRDTVFPASRMRLQVDAISARRAVQEMALRLGQPIPEDAQAETELELRRDVYISQVDSSVFGATPAGTKGKPLPTPAWSAPQLVWRTNLLLPMWAPIKAEVDRQGKIKRLSLNPFIPGNYRPASLEDRRGLAKRVVETVCGSMPLNYEIGDTQGGEQGATYDAVWRAKGDLASFVPRLRTSLLSEKVKEVDCNPREGLDNFNTDTGAIRWFTGSVVAALVIVLFLVGRCHASPWRRRRLALAVPLGLTAEWSIHTALGWPDVPFPVYALELLPAAGLIALALVTSEHFLRRDAPESVASYLAVLKGQLQRPEVGFAILRGAMAGMVFAALETLLAHGSLAASQATLNSGRTSSAALLLAFVDPLPMGRALASFIPTLFGVCTAILDGVMVGVVFLGLPWALLRKSEARVKHLPWYRRPMPPVLLAALIWWVTGFHFCLSEFVLPPLGLVWAFLLEAILLAWLLRRYDVLTVIVAVATTVLWVINYPLLVIFSEVGNTGEWAVFILWGLAVLAAAVVAFRSNLAHARESLQANIQR